MVAQSKGNSLSAKITKKMGKNVWMYYSVLNRLTGGTEDMPGIRLFCFDDLGNDDKNEQQFPILKEKLKESYGSFLMDWDWKKLTPHPSLEKNDKTIVLRHDNDNRIKITLHRNEEDDKKKVEMNIRFISYKDISKYSGEIKSLIWLAKLPRSYFSKGSSLRKWLKSNYISLDIPLIPEKKDARLYFRTLSRESYYTEKYERACLRLTLNEEGERLVKSNEKKIYSLTRNNSNSLVHEQKHENNKLMMINKLKHKISKIQKSKQYNNLNMTIKGLLDYALKERNHEEFKKSISNLAECDEYDEIIREGYECDDLGFPELQIQIPSTNYHFRYKIKGYFPFLSHYDALEKSLPRGFVLSLLRRIARKVKRYSLDMMPQGLRYIVTKMFYDEIKRWWIRMKRSCSNNTTTIDNDIDNEDKTGIANYLLEIGEYIGHREEKYSIEQENAKIYHMIEQRCHELYKEMYTTIENSKDKEIIPIYEHIKKARIPWPRISKILTSINDKYRNRFIITDTCLIARSKAKMLKSLLNKEPLRDEACLSLIKSGVPKSCIVLDLENFLNKLGFGTRSEDSKVELEPNLKHNIFRVVKLKKQFRLKQPLIFQ
jgi:hypothetical protein